MTHIKFHARFKVSGLRFRGPGFLGTQLSESGMAAACLTTEMPSHHRCGP